MSTIDLGRRLRDISGVARSRNRTAPLAAARRIGQRAVLVALGYVLVTGGLLTGLLLQLREEAISAARRELGAFAQLAATHTFEVAFAIEQKLKLAEMTLSVAATAGPTDQESMGPMLRELVGKAEELKDILVLDARGRVIHQASAKGDIGLDWSDRLFFKEIQANAGKGFTIGVPLHGQTQAFGGKWFIPVALPWRGPNGAFRGVLVGLMDPQYFAKAWTFDAEIAGLSIALKSADGALLMRQPFNEAQLGRRPSDEATQTVLSQHRDADTIEAVDEAAGVPALQAFRRINGYSDALIFVAQPMDAVLAGWRHVAWISVSCWVLASLALAGLAAWLGREMKVRGELERSYHALFNSIPQAVIVSDRESGALLTFNDAAVEQYGWSRSDAPPQLPTEFGVLAARRQDFSTARPCLIGGQRHRNAQGAAIDVELTVRQIESDGRPALLTVAADVSDRLREESARKSAEDQLRQSQKMDALGQLTGGIAHDFNNVLMVIMDGAEELSERVDLAAETRVGLGRSADAARRAEELTRQMLAFSRKQPLRPRAVNVNDLVVDTGKLLRRTLGEQIEIDSTLADEVWPVEVDPVQFETCLVNLCLNARDAMPKGGRVVIETTNVTLSGNDVARMSGIAPGDFVRVAICDNGQGILPAHLDKIFEPYFTTKASGKATGLGLSMVYGFVRQSNGHVEVESEIDRGTDVRIYLPRHSATAASSAAVNDTSVKGGSERIRRVINKMVSEEDLIRTVSEAFAQGWRQVKLYFMCGLPTEEDEDVLEIAGMAHRVIKAGRIASGRNDVRCTISIGGFVPKPHTPFQWAAQCHPDVVDDRLRKLRAAVNTDRKLGRNIGMRYHDGQPSLIEGLLARGDRRVGAVIERVWREGGRFDGWSEHFSYPRWVDAAAAELEPLGVSLEWFTTRERGQDEILPWDHLDSGLERDWLWDDWQDALAGREQDDCRWTPCFDCGVCPSTGTDIEVGPSGTTLLPLTVVNPLTGG